MSFSIIFLNIYRISYCYTISTLIKFKWSLHNCHLMLYAISDYLPAFLIMNKIYLSGIIALRRINVSNHPVRCKLNTLNIIRHHPLSYIFKLFNIPIVIQKNIFK